MSLRAREFVDFYIQEFLHPDTYEDEETYDESTENAEECIHLAMMNGISKSEIDEEYGNLVAHIARIHEKIVDAALSRSYRRCA
jgi:hypothetical protein